MNSSRLRPIEAANVDSTPGVSFKVGDRCMARWTDSRKWPGVVQRVLEKGKHFNQYNVCIVARNSFRFIRFV